MRSTRQFGPFARRFLPPGPSGFSHIEWCDPRLTEYIRRHGQDEKRQARNGSPHGAPHLRARRRGHWQPPVQPSAAGCPSAAVGLGFGACYTAAGGSRSPAGPRCTGVPPAPCDRPAIFSSVAEYWPTCSQECSVRLDPPPTLWTSLGGAATAEPRLVRARHNPPPDRASVRSRATLVRRECVSLHAGLETLFDAHPMWLAVELGVLVLSILRPVFGNLYGRSAILHPEIVPECLDAP